VSWQDFGLPPGQDGHDVLAARASRRGTKTAIAAQRRGWSMRRRVPGERDRAVLWLRNAMIALAALAAAAAVVSFAAQFNMIVSVRHDRMIAALEAGIPDASAAIFASLGIALALHGKRAIRARLLNVGAVATSIFMNFIAADPGWRNAAIWVMPPVAYALASDTAIGVIRSWTVARAREMRENLAADEVTPLAVVGALCLWLLRLALAPRSTLGGFRRWVIEECPIAPGRTALPAAPAVAVLPAAEDAVTAPAPAAEGAVTPPLNSADGAVTHTSHPLSSADGAVTQTSHPLRDRGGRGRRSRGRDWDALTEAYRNRLTGAGITREAYESGAPLGTARGHQEGSAS
jgi:hypothetical protein